MVTNIIIW